HFLLAFFVHLLGGFVAGGLDQILQHFDVAHYFGVDLDAGDVLVAVHLDGHHAAARRPFDADQRDLFLHLLLHLLGLLHHGLHVTGHLHGNLPLSYLSNFSQCALAPRGTLPETVLLRDARARGRWLRPLVWERARRSA